jgi:ParB family transcriptional regulator, chromosome partitioning protein
MSEEENRVIPLKKRPMGLGRGLSALLGEIEQEQPVGADITPSEGIRMVLTADLSPMKGQPRKYFDETALEELAQSIAARGLLQPIVVRTAPPGIVGYQIVAGERRWRAAQRAQLHHVPVILKEFDDRTALEIALIENIQREQLNAIEEGQTYDRLITYYGHSQEALGRIVNKSRSHIANLIRLRDLPPLVQDLLAEGKLSMGHARALLTAPDAEMLAGEIIRRALSVRQTEALVRKAKKPAGAKLAKVNGEANSDIALLERQLGDLLGLKVAIAHDGKSGSVMLAYSSLEQLDMICQRLSGERI